MTKDLRHNSLNLQAIFLAVAPLLFFIVIFFYPNSLGMGNFLILFMIWLSIKKKAKYRHLIPFLFILAFIILFWVGVLLVFLPRIRGISPIVLLLMLIGITLVILTPYLIELGKKIDKRLRKKLIVSIAAILLITALIGSYESLCYQVRQGGKPGPSKAAQTLCALERPSKGYLPAQMLFSWLPENIYENKIIYGVFEVISEPGILLNYSGYEGIILIIPLLYIVSLSTLLTKKPKNQQKRVVLISFLIVIISTIALFFLISEVIQLAYVGINLIR